MDGGERLSDRVGGIISMMVFDIIKAHKEGDPGKLHLATAGLDSFLMALGTKLGVHKKGDIEDKLLPALKEQTYYSMSLLDKIPLLHKDGSKQPSPAPASSNVELDDNWFEAALGPGDDPRPN